MDCISLSIIIKSLRLGFSLQAINCEGNIKRADKSGESERKTEHAKAPITKIYSRIETEADAIRL